MDINDPNATLPSKILAFDPARKVEPMPVDLDAPFFTIKWENYETCNHRNRGVTLDTSTRKAVCLCGVVIDNFDALLIYAHAQRRLINHAETIKEHERKEQEKKDRRPFVREHKGFVAFYLNKRVVGYDVNLKCGHTVRWYTSKRRHSPPRTMTCDACYRAWELEQRGVKTVATAKPDAL